ncbi:hypothetical protein V5O48_009779 [Marasmius crinis-equi]|uniref:Uncharacterized protein n=1 Tax=Marasmius crinis-equi TaxID=585013 RepID=A0ABR3FAR2_9AGAR
MHASDFSPATDNAAHEASSRRIVNGEHDVSHLLTDGGDLLLTNRLPPVVEAKQGQWIRTFKNSISSLLTVVSTQLLVVYKARNDRHIGLAILSQLSFIFNLSSSFSAVVLAHKFAALDVVSARRDLAVPQSGYINSPGPLALLRVYGLEPSWYLVVFHWLACFSFGVGTLFAQIMVYAWTDESLSVKITTTCLVAFVFIPLVFGLRLLRD